MPKKIPDTQKEPIPPIAMSEEEKFEWFIDILIVYNLYFIKLIQKQYIKMIREEPSSNRS